MLIGTTEALCLGSQGSKALIDPSFSVKRQRLYTSDKERENLVRTRVNKVEGDFLGNLFLGIVNRKKN